jgi:LPXTG-site transpeptidase (sortase) family protein
VQAALVLVVDLVQPKLTPAQLYDFLGRLLLSTGVVLGSVLGLHFTRERLESQIAQAPRYLSIDSTPVFQLPPATPLPTFTPTPIPTATPLPLPATRLSIPAINLNIRIEETSPKLQKLPNGQSSYIWDPPAYAVGHYDSSGNPGEGRNIVFHGHNNTLGEVFRDLNKLSPGDQIILLTDAGEFYYQVQEKMIIPYAGVEEQANAQIWALTAPQSSERVTLISCWPYATYTNRIVIIAVPVSGGGGIGT